jgi:hypothetical protein
MRVSRAVGWGLTACDVATTLHPGSHESFPLTFGSKALGIGLSVAATWRALHAEESLLRAGHPVWADVVRYGRGLLLLGACGWNLSVVVSL